MQDFFIVFLNSNDNGLPVKKLERNKAGV